MGSYLWVLKYVLQPQNVGKGLIRPVLLQGVQQLVPGACMQDPPARHLYCMEAGTVTVCVLPQLILFY